MRSRIRQGNGGARRRSVVAGLALASLVGATLSAGLTTAPAYAAAPLACGTSTIYNLENTGGLFSLDYTTGANTEIATFPNGSGSNSLGINASGTRAYNFANQSVGIYDRTAESFSTVEAPVGADIFIFGGAVNPNNGLYYVAGSSSTADVLYAFNPATGQWLGRLGSTPLQSGGQRSGDIAFDSQGNLYILQGGSAAGVTNSIVVAAAADVPSAPGDVAFPSSLLTNLPGAPSGNYNGIAFAANGFLYAQATSANTQLLQVNPNDGTIVSSVGQSSSAGRIDRFGDLGGCATPPVLTAQKNIEGRLAANDQFTLTIERNGVATGGGAGTTSGAATGLQTNTAATAGPVVGLSNTTYTVRETAAPGSGANLALYATTYTCTDASNGNRVVTSGSGQLATVVIPAPTGANGPAVNCVFDNTPATYTVSKSVDNTTATAGTPLTYTLSVTNTGPVAYTEANPATLTDDLTNVLDDAAYNGDASEGAVVTGNTLAWSGALGIGQTRTITYSVTPNAPNGTGDLSLVNQVTPTGPGGTCVAAADCTTITPVQSLLINKVADQTEVVPGQVITYTVSVQNTGAVDYTAAAPATFSDDLSAVLDDAVFNDDATATEGSTEYSQPTLTWSGPVAAGDTVTVTYSVTVNDPPTGDSLIDNAVTSTTPGNNCLPGNTDPNCFVEIPARSYTVEKASSASAVNPGDTVTYTVTVTHTGTADYTTASPASFSDDLSAVLDDATYNGDATNGATVTGGTLAWSGALSVGQVIQVTYSVTVDDPNAGDNVLTNTVAPTGPGGRCITQDDCTTTTNVREYTTSKTSSVETATPGQAVTYTVTVTNTGTADYTAAVPATFSDDLSAVLDDATYNGDATAGSSITGTTLAWSGALPVGASIEVTYSVTVNNPATGDNVLTNAVTPTGPGGTCTTAGDCTTTTPIRSYSVDKVASAATLAPGAAQSYTVTVTNTGAVAYTAIDPASFSDDLTAVLDDATYNGDAVSNSDGTTDTGVVDFASPILTWTGPLSVGGTVTVTYTVTVNDPDSGDKVLTNAVVPTGPGGSCATDGDCVTNTPVQSISFTKVADTDEVVAGSTVTYTITATNTGQVAYTEAAPASFTDDLTNVLDDASYNGDANATAGSTSYTQPTLSWSGPVGIGEVATITYSVRVNSPDAGDQVLDNAVVSTVPGSSCTADSADPDCRSVVPAGSFAVTKTASTTTAAQGQKISYTVTVKNTGRTAYTQARPASFRDSFVGVLDDASYNGDVTASAGQAVYARPDLTWSGPLAVDGTVTVTYSVTVNSPDTGDRRVINAVVPTGPGGECTTGGCRTITDVPPGFTVHTGGTSNGDSPWWVLITGALTVLTGAGALWARRQGLGS